MQLITARKAKMSVSELTSGFQKDPLGIMLKLQKESGDLVYFKVLPMLSTYNVFSPDIAYEILVKRPEDFCKPTLGKRLMQSSFGNGIFFSEGAFWRRQRKLAQPAFHHVRIHAYADNMVAHTTEMLNRWQHRPQVDLDREMHALTLMIVVNTLFKTDISGLTDTVGDAMHELGRAVAKQVTMITEAVLPPWVPTTLNRQKQRAVNKINKIVYKLIADRRDSNEDTGDLLSMFMQAVDEETGERMDDLQVRDELMTMFIAGHETSALGLSWSLVEIAHNPDVEAKLHAEIDTVLQGRPPQLSDLPQLPYTQKIIKEALRKYPPALFISRQPVAPTYLGESRVPKTALINVMPYVIHHDPRWYNEPMRFNPDRWTEDFEKQLPKCTYFPFGAGPRICIGNGFAMMEMQLVLATIVQRYRLSLVDDSKVAPMFGLTLGFKNPVRMQITERIPQAQPTAV